MIEFAINLWNGLDPCLQFAIALGVPTTIVLAAVALFGD